MVSLFFYFFEDMNIDNKIIKHRLPDDRCRYIFILSKLLKVLEVVSSLHNRAKTNSKFLPLVTLISDK